MYVDDIVILTNKVEDAPDYKNLGCWINEYGSFDKTVESLTAA